MVRNNTLARLTTDERTIMQRKTAIAMYGYSWLKPAGCPKTMLGRREEEVEREEVERQLREVEVQERLQQEAEEQDRLARLGETGEPDGDRDLDEDIPEADEEAAEEALEDDLGSEEEGYPRDGEDEDMEGGDLDDEIPDADEDGDDDDEVVSPDPDDADANWVYDTRREPDTDDDGGVSSPARIAQPQRHVQVAGVRVPVVPGSEYDYDEREAEDLANAMLDEDEIFDDGDDGVDDGERDLDDDVPEADSDQAWEHTDTELEESEMDISILPQGQPPRSSLPGQARLSSGQPSRQHGSSARHRSSGPWISDPSPQIQGPDTAQYYRPTPESSSVYAAARDARTTMAMSSNNRHGRRQYLHTPAVALDSPLEADTELMDVANEDDVDSFAAANTEETQQTGRLQNPSSRTHAARNWLDGAAAAVGGSARRTLFGRTAAARRGNTRENVAAAAVIAAAAAAGGRTTHAPSSGGLFTPASVAGAAGANVDDAVTDWDTPINQTTNQQNANQTQAQAPGRRRSGRFLRRGRGEGE
jgi:hypothetical protein